MAFRANPALKAQLARDPAFRAGLDRMGKEMAAEAKALARSEAYETGAYHDSIEGGVGDDDEGAVARVVARDDAALIVEFGTSRQPAKAILRRAAEAAGHRVTRSRR